jgi:TRAP-type mannitol/chloroaromatic compound transport system permease large subunit
MKKYNHLIFVSLMILSLSMSSCRVVGDIFKAGVWTGFFLIVVVIALVIWLITRFRRK